MKHSSTNPLLGSDNKRDKAKNKLLIQKLIVYSTTIRIVKIWMKSLKIKISIADQSIL
jgi:hypothetical protein